MSTDLSKPDTEVTVSLDTILDMDEGEDNILGQANISDLLDTDVGADISGHQSGLSQHMRREPGSNRTL